MSTLTACFCVSLLFNVFRFVAVLLVNRAGEATVLLSSTIPIFFRPQFDHCFYLIFIRYFVSCPAFFSVGNIFSVFQILLVQIIKTKHWILSCFNPREWNRNISDDFRLAMRAEYDCQQASWLAPFCDQLSSSVQQLFKRSNPMHSPGSHSTPKRPRPQNIPSPSLQHSRSSTVTRSQYASETIAPRVRKSLRTFDLSHAQEMKRCEDANVINSENFQSFIKVLRTFVRRPRDLANADIASEFDPDLLATANTSDVHDLDRGIRLVIEQGALGHASPDLLSRVLMVLQKRVRACCRITEQSGNGHTELSSLNEASLGVFCASTILLILSAPRIPRVLLVQELLEDVVNLLRCISTSIIFPMFDPLYKDSKTVKDRSERKQKSHSLRGGDTNHATVANTLDENGSDFDKSRTRSRHSAFKKDDYLMDNFYSMLDGFISLFEKENHITDDIVDKCAVACLQTLSVTGLARLQSHAIKVVSTIFLWYPARRIYILDNAQETVKSIPAARKHLRTYQLSENNCAVRPCSALLCLLLCIASNDPEERKDRKQGVVSEDELESWCNSRLSRHHRAVKLTVHVLEPLLEKFSTDRDVEVRAAMQSFFQDLLTLYGLPEWPAAELMLQTISVSIITKLRDLTEKSVYTRVQAIETLGEIASKICELHGNLLLKSAKILSNSVTDTDKIEESRVKTMLFLGQKRSLYTDTAYAFLEAMFFSDDHSYATNIGKREQRTYIHRTSGERSNEDITYDDEQRSTTSAALLKGIQQCALMRSEKVANGVSRDEDLSRSDAVDAFRFVSAHRSFAAGIKTIIASICDGIYDPAPTIRAKSIKALSAIDTSCRGLLEMFPTVAPCVEASCRDVSILTRDAALELLSRSLVFKPSRTSDTNLNEIIGQRRQNGHGSEHFENTFEIVMRRMCDSATSVRKRAIGISRSILVEALKYASSVQRTPLKGSKSSCEAEMYEKLIIRICTGLVQRLGDPETSVREHAERVLRCGLFGYDTNNTSTWNAGEDYDSPRQMARRLTSVYINLPGNVHVTFMPRVVHKTMLEKEKPLLTAIVNAAVEELHGYEARISQLNAEKNSNCSPELSFDQIKSLSIRRVGCSSVICAFGFLDASLVEPHCRSLAPSIKGVVDGLMSETDLLNVQKILNVLEVGLGKCQTADASLIEEVLQDVELIVCQSPIALLEEAAVKCLCVVAKKSKDQGEGGVVERSAKAFKNYLDDQIFSVEGTYASQDERRIAAFERHVRCALVRLGLLSRYGSFNDNFVANIYNSLKSLCNSVCFDDIREVLSKASVRALSHFLIRNRSFLHDGTKIFTSLMKLDELPYQKGENISFDAEGNLVDANMRKDRNSLILGIKLCILQGFYELLRDEEERNSVSKEGDLKVGSNDKAPWVNKRDDNHKTPTVSEENEKGSSDQNLKEPHIVLAAEEDAEAGFLALSAQALFPLIEKCSRSPSTSIRRIVANIVGLLVRQGLLLPASVVACLFGLLLDQDSGCREYSMRVVSFIADRHSGMLTSAAVPALRSCFRTACEVYRASEVANLKPELKTANVNKLTYEQICMICIDPKSGQSLLSAAIMSLRREQRRGVLETVLREFDPRVTIQVAREKGAKIGNTILSEVGESDGSDVDNVRPIAGKQISLSEFDLNGSNRGSLAVLHFLAMTLACLDYTNGSGIGGSLTQGGGTAVAESKMKIAKEEVTELVGIATRIISNSGQAILQASKHICKRKGEEFVEQKKRIAFLAARMNLLLALKHHLKFVRWKRVTSPDDDCDEEDLSMTCRMPEFHPDMEVLNVIGWEENEAVEILSEECADRQIQQLFKLMEEDAIDESDLNASSRRGRGAGRGRGKVGNRGRHLTTGKVERSNRKLAPNSDFETPMKGNPRATRRETRSCVKRKTNYIDSESSNSAE